VLTEGMIDPRASSRARWRAHQATRRFKRYYMHRTSHWLGMDVHDVGRYYLRGTSRALEPGMVLTVEPGIYIAPRRRAGPRRPARHRHPHRRRRAVTQGEPDVLTADAPKSIEDIEALVGTADLPR
jgi:Xaa-Pro aminopeptidase